MGHTMSSSRRRMRQPIQTAWHKIARLDSSLGEARKNLCLRKHMVAAELGNELGERRPPSSTSITPTPSLHEMAYSARIAWHVVYENFVASYQRMCLDGQW